MEELNLKKTDNGIVQVVTTTQTQEVPFSCDEIKRQIEQHVNIVNTLQKQLEAIQQFEASEDIEATVATKELAEPIINQAVSDQVTVREVKEVELAEAITKEGK